jgi:hypothetical protein
MSVIEILRQPPVSWLVLLSHAVRNSGLILACVCFATATLLAQSDNESQKRDFDRLLSSVMPFAEQMLTKNGGFFPYGWTMNSDGNITAAAGYTGVEQPKSQEIIDLLKGAFHRQAQDGTIKACALAYDIRAIPPGQTEKTDAIAVNLDHRGGMSIVAIYPYSIENKKVIRGKSWAVKGEGKIFATDSSSH